MTSDIDSILASVTELTRRIEALDPDDPEAVKLVAQREALRTTAREIADLARHPTSVETEIEMLNARLQEINDMAIGKGYAEKWMKKTIQDPGAYSHNINKQLAADHAEEVEAIMARLAILDDLDSTTE